MDKQELTERLDQTFDELSDWSSHLTDQTFIAETRPGKWSAAGHIDHVRKSAKGFSKALSMPKDVLEATFGMGNHSERNYDVIVATYEKTLNAGPISQAAVGGQYHPRDLAGHQRSEVLTALQETGSNLTKALNKWSEEDLSRYVVPHPIMGNFTLREMCYFTIHHTLHHLKMLREWH